MSLGEYRTQLRGATARADTPVLIELLTSVPWPKEALQLVGDAVLVAVVSGASDALVLARRCVAALGERDWEGDAELAAALSSAVDDGPTPMLRPLPVDLEELAAVLEGDPVHGGGRIELRSGEVWPLFVFDDFTDDDEDEDPEDDDPRWLWVDPQGSRQGYRDMELFIGTVDDRVLVDRLTIAIAGRGAFRRFKDVIADSEAVERWYTLSEDRLRGRARAWLAAQGYTPTRAQHP